MLLFKTFELNGCRSSQLNDSLKTLLQSITAEKIAEFSNKYDIIPVHEAWKKNLIAGSDDHIGINIGKKYTEVEKASDYKDFLKQVFEDGNATIHGEECTPKGVAHSVYSIGYQYYSSKYNIARFVTKDPTLTIIDKLLTGEDRQTDIISKIVSKFRDTQIKYDIREETKPGSIKRILFKTILSKHEHIIDDATPENLPGKWFEIVNSVANQGLAHLLDRLLDTIKSGNFLDIFHILGSAGSLSFMMSPYFISYGIAERDKLYANKLLKEYNQLKRPVKIAHFTDTYYDINGVAKTMQQNLRIAKKLGKDLTIITSENTKSSKYQNINGEMVFDPVGQCEIPEYPELKFNYPPFLEVLDYCYSNNFTHFHSATPGTVGLVALAIAKILKKPIYGTYHTAFPQYLLQLTGDPTMEELAWKYMIWYYNQMDVVYVPSNAMGRELAEKGIDERKIKLYPRGVDIQKFRPMPKDISENRTLLYVGRVSKEKNLHILAGAFKKISPKYPDVILKIVGDGPYRSEMESVLSGYNVEFLGYVQGDDLVKTYSNADVFVFPSTTDTFGNVALEAQACGTPVIVTDSGGPMENIIPNETGIIVKGEDENALAAGIKKLLDSNRLEQMSQKCREYMEKRSFESAFLETWHLYETHIQ